MLTVFLRRTTGDTEKGWPLIQKNVDRNGKK